MLITEKYGQIASDETIRNTVTRLMENGIRVFLVNNKKEAREKAIEFIPRKSEVMTMTSVTLSEIGLDILLNESESYASIRNRLEKNGLEKIEKMRLGAAHEWTVGSVHAITEDGHVVIASATGSQLPAYAYGAPNVLWIAWAQKIVKNLDEAMERINEYVFPLENERAMKEYGVGSGVNKVLIVNKEANPGRIHLILVKEKLGF